LIKNSIFKLIDSPHIILQSSLVAELQGVSNYYLSACSTFLHEYLECLTRRIRSLVWYRLT